MKTLAELLPLMIHDPNVLIYPNSTLLPCVPTGFVFDESLIPGHHRLALVDGAFMWGKRDDFLNPKCWEDSNRDPRSLPVEVNMRFTNMTFFVDLEVAGRKYEHLNIEDDSISDIQDYIERRQKEIPEIIPAWAKQYWDDFRMLEVWRALSTGELVVPCDDLWVILVALFLDLSGRAQKKPEKRILELEQALEKCNNAYDRILDKL